jgi:hypothetical protein
MMMDGRGFDFGLRPLRAVGLLYEPEAGGEMHTLSPSCMLYSLYEQEAGL